MSDYTPPDALNVILNFTKEATLIDSHNVILNFGAEDGFNYANISIDTAFKFSAAGTVEPPIDIHGTANIVVDTSFLFSSVGTFDINHIVGVSLSCNSSFQKAFACLSVVEIPWAKPIFKAHNSAFYFERGLTFSNQVFVGFDKAAVL